MADKKAFLVFGPESSGCRFFTKVLIMAGCGGDEGHKQRWDNEEPVGNMVVWRRSFPHFIEHIWEDIPRMVGGLRNLGYEVKAFVTTRDWKPMLASQIGKHVKNREEGFKNLQKAYPYIFSNLEKLGVQFAVVSYEAILLHGDKYLKEVLRTFGLVYKKVKIENGNSKYY